MVRILEARVHLVHPFGEHRHCLIAQIPVRLRRADRAYALRDPEETWRTIASVLDLVASEREFRKLHFLVFPECALPAVRLDDALARVDRLAANTVTLLGLEHVPLRAYRALLERFRHDNAAAIPLVDRDIANADILDVPVNACAVVVKDAAGELRVFLQAKTHPYAGEEFLDKGGDLYHGRHFWLFRGAPACFNFMTIICLDYLYRTACASNLRAVVDRANALFFETRQTLDALFVLQCNPKPEHRAYRDALTGFYGELLEETPGVRDTVTVFANCSDESALEGDEAPGRFGASAVVIPGRQRLPLLDLPEFSTDDLGGAPVWRVRFRTPTRLVYFNLPLAVPADPRGSRVPLKVHAILIRGDGGAWEQVRREALAHMYEIAARPEAGAGSPGSG